MNKKSDTEALIDYMTAYKKYNNVLDEYFPINKVMPGEEIKLGKPLTAEVLVELDKLANEVEEKRKVWMNYLK